MAPPMATRNVAKLCSLITLAALTALTGCPPSSSDDKPKKSADPDERPSKKPLQEREDALFGDLMKIGGKNKDDCNKMGEEMKALIKKESDTVAEINKTFDAMSADEKENKKKASQARQNKYDQGMAVIICSVSNADVKDANDKVVPATK